MSLEEWVDKLAIRDVVERYMRYNDDGALDRLIALFDEEAIYEVTGHILKGHKEIRAFFGRAGFRDNQPLWTDEGARYNEPRSIHVASNPIIELDGNTAVSELDFTVLSRDAGGHTKLNLIGRYRDRLRKDENGNWLIVWRTGVSSARKGNEYTNAEWTRALATMSAEDKAKLP
jgi:hypothetical protein